MPANKGQIAKNAIALYFRMAIVLVVALYTARVVLQQLGASDYGTFNVVGGVIAMLSFLTSTLSQGIQRFFNYYKGKNDLATIRKVLWSSIVVMVVISLIIVLFGETIGLWFLNSKLNIPSDRMIAANWVYQFSIISMLVSFIAVPFQAMIVAHEDFNYYAYISIGTALLNLGIAFLLQTTGFDKLIYYAVLVCMLHSIQSITYFAICKAKYKEITILRHREISIYKSLLLFSGWNVLGTATFTAGTTGINIILNIFFGTIVNAARGVAVQVSSKVDEFINNIQQAMNPQITQLYARGEIEEMQSLVDDNFRWNFALYWMIALPLLFQIDYILEIWLGEVPEYTSFFTMIIVIRSLLKCFERPINTINFAIGDIKPLNLFATFSVSIMIALTVLMFSLGFPPYWAFILDCISIAACCSFYMLCASRHKAFSIRHFIKKILIPVTAVIAISLLSTYLMTDIGFSGFPKLVFTLCITTFVSGNAIFFILFTKSNRQGIFNRLKLIFKRKI